MAIHMLTRSQNVVQKLSWIFRLYDTDEDGYLTNENLAEILTSIYVMNGQESDLANESAAKHVKTLGFLNLTAGGITESEFIDACRQVRTRCKFY